MLIKINGILNSEEYITLLKSYLLQVIEGEIFQHEETPCNTLCAINKFFLLIKTLHGYKIGLFTALTDHNRIYVVKAKELIKFFDRSLWMKKF